MEDKVSKIKFSFDVAAEKMRSWCAYQERSQQEARQKLYGYGLTPAEIEQVIADLISANYLNEERFAMAYASGKFRIKHWGKNKIAVGLKKHRIPVVIVNKALLSIDEREYLSVIKKAIEKKLRTSKADDLGKRYYSTLSYLVSRGFENHLISELLKEILKGETRVGDLSEI